MKNLSALNCGLERPLNLVVGALLFFAAVGFALMGVTILPVIGFLVAVPVMFVAFFFLFAPRSKECRVNFS